MSETGTGVPPAYIIPYGYSLTSTAYTAVVSVEKATVYSCPAVTGQLVPLNPQRYIFESLAELLTDEAWIGVPTGAFPAYKEIVAVNEPAAAKDIRQFTDESRPV
ncbi:MAG TPA: hypothetical protein VGM51_15055 [Armatimonadota bacterium]